jgi:hypothetical protein
MENLVPLTLFFTIYLNQTTILGEQKNHHDAPKQHSSSP